MKPTVNENNSLCFYIIQERDKNAKPTKTLKKIEKERKTEHSKPRYSTICHKKFRIFMNIYQDLKCTGVSQRYINGASPPPKVAPF